MPDFQVPSWLQPPSQQDREQLALMEEQVKQKGVSMLRKQVGMAKMKSDAQKNLASGMDEATARKLALLDNADLIFVDEPGALVNLIKSDEANAIRERAQEMLAYSRERTASIMEDRNREIERKDRALEEQRRLNQISLDDYRGSRKELEILKQERDMLKTKADILYKEKDYELNVRQEQRQRLAVVAKDTRYQLAAAKLDAAKTKLEAAQKSTLWSRSDPLKVAAAQVALAQAKRDLDELTQELMGEEDKKSGITSPGVEKPKESPLAPPASADESSTTGGGTNPAYQERMTREETPPTPKKRLRYDPATGKLIEIK